VKPEHKIEPTPTPAPVPHAPTPLGPKIDDVAGIGHNEPKPEHRIKPVPPPKLNGGPLRSAADDHEDLWLKPGDPHYPLLEERKKLRAEDRERAQAERAKRREKAFSTCHHDPAARFCKAARTQQFMVWLYLVQRYVMRGNPVTVANGDLEQLGVDRKTKARALRAGVEAGLISVSVGRGRAPVVTILDPLTLSLRKG
jgi:hypothetical protein